MDEIIWDHRIWSVITLYYGIQYITTIQSWTANDHLRVIFVLSPSVLGPFEMHQGVIGHRLISPIQIARGTTLFEHTNTSCAFWGLFLQEP